MTSRGDVRIEIVAGGRPDAATVAAIGLALRAVRAATVPSRPRPVTSAWRRAALREGVGGAPQRRPDGRA